MKEVLAFVVLVLTPFASSCGSAHAVTGPSAQVVPAPVPGYTCFAIMNGDQAVGGNCVASQ